jgi:hypothetical protein
MTLPTSDGLADCDSFDDVRCVAQASEEEARLTVRYAVRASYFRPLVGWVGVAAAVAAVVAVIFFGWRRGGVRTHAERPTPSVITRSRTTPPEPHDRGRPTKPRVSRRKARRADRRRHPRVGLKRRRAKPRPTTPKPEPQPPSAPRRVAHREAPVDQFSYLGR